MNDQILHFVFSQSPPGLDQMEVFDTDMLEFEGSEFYFKVIGYSHYIIAPDIDYYELCSCRPPTTVGENARTEEIPLSKPQEYTFTVTTEAVKVDVTVETGPLSMFPAGENYDLKHEFGTDAYTTIAIDQEEGTYETYHTYPEFDLTIYTKNQFSQL